MSTDFNTYFEDFNSNVVIEEFVSYEITIYKVLNLLDFGKTLENLEESKKIIIKPNLLEIAPPPCTTDVRCIESVVKFIREINPVREVVIIEGSGGCETEEAFKLLDYTELEKKYAVKLIDVDNTELLKVSDLNASIYKEIYLPSVLFNGFIISIPVLKDHMMTEVTLGMKNLIGLLPKKYYGGYWSYNRSDVHRVGVNNAIFDLNLYIKISLNIIDGTIGQSGSHLPGGRRKNPPVNKIIAGYDALEVDKIGAELLGHKYQDIKHLMMISNFKKSNFQF